jgi:Lon protease-like protein
MAEALVELPLFPLQTVLFPGGLLPLQIFEVRYLDMIGRCHKENQPFGVVSLTQGREVRQPKRGQPADPAPLSPAFSPSQARSEFVPEGFHAIGTLAHIEVLERPQPGLMRIRCSGGQRFKLKSSEQLKHGLWMGTAELMANDAEVPVPDDLSHARRAMKQVIEQLKAQVEDDTQMPMQPPYRWNDCGWLSNRWSELLPVSSQMKQQFMSLDNPLVRLELVADLLDQMKFSNPADEG